jgi:spermidine synthase
MRAMRTGYASRWPAAGIGPWRGGFDSWVPVLFLASGAAGLIYQVVWTQDLVLIFGDTTLAIVTTVSAFLAGLGIGSLVGAALGARLRRALAVYGLVEMAVGCLALLMPFAFDGIATAFRSAYLSLPSGEVGLIRFGLAFVALAPVTMLMGMSLPLLTRHLVREDPQIGGRIARLYGLNTLGAVVGSALSGYVLIELIGLRDTTFVAVALNLCAGGGAVLMSRAFEAGETEPRPPAGPRPPLVGRQRLLLAVTFTSGLVSLALEMLWTRMMLQGTGSSIYVFIVVVAVFLIGIAGGSLIYERQRDRSPQLATLGALFAAAGALAIVPMLISNVYGPPWLPLAVLFILPVTLIFGYTFPLTVRLFVDSADQASRGVGFAYAANTAGCVAGTVLAGFVLIPELGTSTSIIAAGLVLTVLGGALAIGYAPRPEMPRREIPRREMLRREMLRPGISLAAALALLVVLFIPAAKMTYIQNEVAATGAPTAHYEDSVASVDVTGGPPASRNLYINGVGITKLTVITKELAYLPKAIRPSATTMLNICFGMGGTYRSSIILGLHTTAVELDPTVPTVMSWFYPDASKYLHSPLGNIIISDGRNYVRLSNKRYDLITIDSPPPIWSAGAVVLLTQEFYQEAAQRLAPGGLMASYLPLESKPLEKLILRTFRSEFRYMAVVWDPHHTGDYILGSQAPITFNSATIQSVFGSPSARADLADAPDANAVPRSGAQWVSFIHRSVWLADSNQVAAYTGAGPLLTDDHPLTEYFLFAGYGIRSETLVVRLILVVTGLLVLLIIGAALDFVSRRRSRPAAAAEPPRDLTGDASGDSPDPAVTQTEA